MMNWDTYATLLDMEQTERAEKGLPPIIGENQEEILMKKRENKIYKLDQKTVDLVRHILKARIQNAHSLHSKLTFRTALDLFDYALENRTDCLEQFDYYALKEEE